MDIGFLIYLQDVGGANYLLPLLSRLSIELRERLKIVYLIHPLSQETVTSDLLQGDIVDCTEFPISTQRWSEIFQENNVKFILSTLSANHYDLSNANLIVAATGESISTIGFLDHWKGFDRLFDDKGNSLYCPTWLGVIDDFSVSSLCNKNLIAKVESVGHPVLESFSNRKIVRQKTYNSLFLIPYGTTNLLQALIDAINNLELGYQLYYRPHPKEATNNLLGSTIQLDNSNKFDLYDKYDIFIGFDSMLLFEAQLSGANCISIHFSEVKTIYRDEVPYTYALNVEDMSEFDEAIKGTIPYPQLSASNFSKSSQRCLDFINSFIEGTSNA